MATMFAHAKVNLYLAVGGRRPDRYHDVTTVIQAISLADEVLVSADADADEVVCEGLEVPAEENLAWRAVVAYREALGAESPVRVEVRKRIPTGAGLGGGSADAAAVLCALENERCPADGIVPTRLIEAAASVGADVPFFLGPGTQLLGGRGDELIEVLPTPDLHVVVVNPGVPVPTGAAYAAFDRMLRGPDAGPEELLAGLRQGDVERIARSLFNNMTEASAGLVSPIRDALRFLEHSDGVLGCAMAGSGSSVFGICSDETAAATVAGEAIARGWWSVAVRSVPAGLTRSGTRRP